MQITRDPRLRDFPELLSFNVDDSPIAWVGDLHYRNVYKPKGNPETPLLAMYPAGSPCDESLVQMMDLAVDILAEDDGPAVYTVPFPGFTDHRGMERSGQNFSNSYKFVAAWGAESTIGLMTPYGILGGGGCDKTFPMLLHLMGLPPYRYLPWALLQSGHRSVGVLPDGREVTLSDLAAARHRFMRGLGSQEEVDQLRAVVVRDVGVCENLASAMSQFIASACGGFILAGYDLHASHWEGREEHVRTTMKWYRHALGKGIVPADTVTEENWINYQRAIALFTLSTNLPLHLPWIVKSWGLNCTPETIWENMKDMPWLTDLQPVGQYTVNHIGENLPSFIRYLVKEGLLYDVKTIYGAKLSEVYADAPRMDFEGQQKKVFYPASAPLASEPQVVLYGGNLCPIDEGGAWVKHNPDMMHTGVYEVIRFDSQKEFFAATQNGTEFTQGACYVISGSLTMVELLSVNTVIAAAMEADPALDIVLLTDQRTSGFAGKKNKCKAAYHMPRPRLRSVRTGNLVRFDPPMRTIDLVDTDHNMLTEEIDALAGSYEEEQTDKTGTVLDLLPQHLGTAKEGCGI